MKRQSGKPDRDGNPRDAYLNAEAYPVDPGYRGYDGDRDRPRPADVPPRTRPDRSMPPRSGAPRPGVPPRAYRQAPRDPQGASRPWQRPDDAMPGVGRPRPRPRQPGPRPRPQPGGRPGPAGAAEWEGQWDQYGCEGLYGPERYGPEQYGPEQPWAGGYGPGQQPPWQPVYGPPGPGQGRQGEQWPGQAWRGPGQPAAGPEGYGPQASRPDQGYPGPGRGQQGPGQYGAGQPNYPDYGPGEYGPGRYDPQQYRAARQGARPDEGQDWAPRPGRYGHDRRGTGPSQAAGRGSGQAWTPGPGQYGPGQYGPGARDAAAWQPDAPGPGQDWHQPGQYEDSRSAGSWQAAGPGSGQEWAGSQGYDRDPRNMGSWQSAAPGQGQAWTAGPGQYPHDARAAGGWQAAGAAGQDWAGPAEQGQPFPGQPHPGPRFPGQYPGQQAGRPQQTTGRLGEPHYAEARAPNTGAFGRVGSPVISQRDSALPDPPPGGRGPAPIAAIEADSVVAFARDLRVLRAKAGLDYPDMAEKSHYTMRTLASAAGGLRLPTLPVLIAYVNACDGDVGEWEERWGKLSKSARKGQVVAVTSDDRAKPAVGAPPNTAKTGEIYVITTAKMRDERW